MVHITRQERNLILFSLLMDGVITCKKEFEGQHPYIPVENLKVWMLTRTLKSKGYLDEIFNWRHLYFSLNPNGVQYLKQVLGIDEVKVQPETYIPRPEQPEPEAERPERRPRREGEGPREGGRDGPRRGGEGGRGRGRGGFRGRGGPREGGREGGPREGGDRPYYGGRGRGRGRGRGEEGEQAPQAVAQKEEGGEQHAEKAE